MDAKPVVKSDLHPMFRPTRELACGGWIEWLWFWIRPASHVQTDNPPSNPQILTLGLI